ncbi:O-antigen ligase family protein [Acinetobacter towneri]|uniref:O-antigen ligase family protein n=1 Tax=Acinetobacter towneri TaxID=202956 RepID=UPI00037A3770
MLVRKDNLSKILFLILMVDILILPYFPFFAINTLFFLVFYDFLCDRKFILDEKFLCFSLVFLVFALISTYLSYYSDNYNLGFFSENIKRFFQLLLCFVFYIYFYNFFRKNRSNKETLFLIRAFFICVFTWAVIYYFSLDNFLTLKGLFNRNDSFIDMYEGGENNLYRFSYIWTDPNNIAYAILGVFLFAIFNLKVSVVESFLYLAIVFFVCLLSMSTTAWLILFAIVMPCFFYNLNYKDLKTLLFVFSIIVLFLIFGLKVISNVLQSDVALSSFERFESNNIGTESGNSRLEIWKKIFSYYGGDLYKYVFWGQGYQLHHNDQLIKPHNGFFLILFAYGFFASILFMYVFFNFKLNKKYIFMIPFFLCFFINVMIGELKLFLLYVFLLAFVRANAYK